MLRLILIAAGLAAAAAPSWARPPLPAEGPTLAQELVHCDRARLLSNPPTREAARVYVQVEPGRFELALPPDFTPAGGWYDQDVERAFERLRRRGLVSREEVRAARAAYGQDHGRGLGAHPRLSERRRHEERARLCSSLVKSAWR
jgi:hypothetical protein